MRHTSPAPGSGNEAPHCRSIQEQRTPTMRLTCTRFPKSDRPARQPRGLVLEAQDLQGSARARSLRSFSLLRQGMRPQRTPRIRVILHGSLTHVSIAALKGTLNHPTPAVQLGIVLQGVFSITTTDGETRRLPPGSVFRLEDTSPCKGHITVVGDQTAFLMFVR